MTTPPRLLCGLAAVFALSGCATLPLPWFDKVPEASAKNPVVQITCLWEPSEGNDPNGAPCRGFAGQILFLGNKGGMPVKINSPVMVYVFDDQGTPEEQAVPVHQFNFDAVSWDRHLRVSSLGPTYHVFIPYTRPGDREAICSLRLKLTNPDGSTMFSDRAEVPLKGRKRDDSGSNLEVISHHGKRAPLPVDEGPRTTTIPLSGNDASPTNNEAFDQERANFLLQQFLLDQSKKNMDRGQTSGAINRGGMSSERIRWSGDSTQPVAPVDRQLSLVDR